jgi:glucosamine kinase
MNFFVGVDGGRTRSTVTVTDAQGVELARVTGPAAVPRTAEPLTGSDALVRSITSAMRMAGLAPPATSLCCALAGAGAQLVRETISARLTAAGLASHAVVVTDAEAALQDAFGDGPGLILISGTGSVAWGRGSGGQTARAGGWGRMVGDEGSGFAIGIAALRAVMQAHDRRSPPTMLTERILTAISAKEAPMLVDWSERASKADIAGFAPLVLDAAEHGDAHAVEIVDDAAAALARHVHVLIERLGPWDAAPRLSFGGGLLTRASTLKTAVIRAIGRDDEVVVNQAPLDPARGAGAIARAAVRPA